jgi:hypothetical protein
MAKSATRTRSAATKSSKTTSKPAPRGGDDNIFVEAFGMTVKKQTPGTTVFEADGAAITQLYVQKPHFKTDKDIEVAIMSADGMTQSVISPDRCDVLVEMFEAKKHSVRYNGEEGNGVVTSVYISKLALPPGASKLCLSIRRPE